MNILLIGCGKMGGAMLTRWIDRHLGQFVVVDPKAASVPAGATLLRDPSDLLSSQFDVVVGAVKPQVFDEVLPQYRDIIQRSGCFMSIAAGCSLERIECLVGDVPVIRAMPNLPALIGKGVTGLLANAHCNQAQKRDVEQLAGAVGSTYWLSDEDEIDRLTAISGSGPGYVFEIARSYIDAAKDLGFDDATARNLVLQTIMGTIEMAIQADEPVESLRNSVTSKNGTTAAGLEKLTQDGALAALFQRTTGAAYVRARDLR